MPRRFLLIDDDADDRELFCEALETIDALLVCDCVSSTDEALRLLKGRADALPLIIFLDINLPGTSGWQCLTTLKKSEEFKHIPVIIYSTTSHEKEKERAKESGALTFFTKPHSFDDLKRKLRFINNHVECNTIHELGNKPITG